VSAQTERLFIWCGVAGMMLIFAGFLAGHLVPPPSPNESAIQITTFYRRHLAGLRWGSIVIGFGAALLAPWLSVMTERLKTIEGHGSLTAYCQLALGALFIFEIVLPITVLQVVLFRLNRPIADTQALSDLFLILFISPAYTFIVELVVTAVAIWRDTSRPRVFPGWLAAVNVGTAVFSFPGVFVIFEKMGPFAWSGAFGFWMPAAVFGIWVVTMTLGLFQRVDAVTA
jgi:hypothetical protein